MLSLFSLVFAQAVPASPDYAGHCQSPLWSPDGTTLAWEVNYLERQTIDLFLAPFSSSAGTPRRIVPVSRGTSALTAGFDTADTDMVVHELSFSPVGPAQFVYSTSGTTRDYEIYVDGTGVVAPASGTDGGPAFSPDGRYIVFTSARTGQGDLYLIDLHNPSFPLLRITGAESSAEVFATWSADSQRIAFVGHTDNGDNIYLIDDIRFPAPRPFTTWSHTQTRPSFSPDGTMIAYYSNHHQVGRFDLYIQPISGGTATLVDTDVFLNPRGPVWTPDSRNVLYVKSDENALSPVYAAPVRQPSARRIIPTGTVGNTDLDLVRRADGKLWLAVAAQGRTGDAVRDFRRIYVMPVVL